MQMKANFKSTSERRPCSGLSMCQSWATCCCSREQAVRHWLAVVESLKQVCRVKVIELTGKKTTTQVNAFECVQL